MKADIAQRLEVKGSFSFSIDTECLKEIIRLVGQSHTATQPIIVEVPSTATTEPAYSNKEMWVNAKKLAEYFGIRETWIRDRSGPNVSEDVRVPHIKLGRLCRYEINTVRKWLMK